MKKLILIVFLLVGCISAQPRWFADELFYPSVNTLGSTTYFQINVSGQTKVISGTVLTSLLNSDPSADYNWTGTHYHSKPMQLAASPDASLERGWSFSGDTPAWTINNTIYKAASEAFVANYVGASGDSSAFVTKAGNDTITGPKRVTNLFDLKDATVYMPYLSSLASDSLSGNFKWYFSDVDSLIHLYAKNNANDKFHVKFITERYLNAKNYGTASGSYWNTSTDQSGLGGTKTLNSGGITFGSGTTLEFEVNSSLVRNYYTDALPAGSAGLSFYYKAGGFMYNRYYETSTVYHDFVTKAKASDMIDDAINFTTSTVSNDTIDYDAKTIKYYVHVDGNKNIYFINVKPKDIKLRILNDDDYTVTFHFPSAYTFKWDSGLAYTGNGTNDVQTVMFEVWDNNLIYGYAYGGSFQ